MKMPISYKKRSSRRTKGYLFISLLVNTIMIYRLSNGFADICKMLQMNGDNLCLGIKPISFLCVCVCTTCRPQSLYPSDFCHTNITPSPRLAVVTARRSSTFHPLLSPWDVTTCVEQKYFLFFPWHRE